MAVHNLFSMTYVVQSFNEGLEELYKAQKAWAIPDREQRQSICQAQREMVSKAYTAFLLREVMAYHGAYYWRLLLNSELALTS